MRRRGKTDQGITLIELLVAIFVLSLASVAALRSINQSTQVIGQEEARFVAHLVAVNRAEEVRFLGLDAARGLPASVEMAQRSWDIEMREASAQVGFVELRLVVSSRDGPGAVLVTYVEPQQ